MHLMLQQDEAADCVVATGITQSVRDLCATAFGHVGLDWRDHVREAPGDYRQTEAVQLVGDATRARQRLGWQPTMPFRELIASMVDHDLRLLAAKPQIDNRND
jgi:GDPmannose 4,6-dehydratase